MSVGTVRPRLLADRRPGARLMGFGAAQPEHSVGGAELGAPFGKGADWIKTRTGIGSLRRLGAGQPLADLAQRAAEDALAAAGVPSADIDLVVVATCSSDPGVVQAALSARGVAPTAGWMQLNSACSGFSYAVSTADNLIRSGQANHVLVVAAEQMSSLVDPADLGTSIIFGDGAGAAVLGPGQNGRTCIGPMVAGSDGGQAHLIQCDTEGPGFMRMAGQHVFRWAVEHMPPVAREACARAGVAVADIEVFVPHQANLRIIDAVTRAVGLTHAVVADDVTTSGNTSAASIPIALTRLIQRGRVRTGQLALLLGFGAGLAYAAQVVEIP
jgi:3-oxoacyl-[acyl-carrier-protein] synthase-3